MITSVVKEVSQYADSVLVIDDGSSDNTSQAAWAAGATALRHVINRGQGAALMTGTQYALSQGADIIVHFDADGQQLPSEIPLMCQPILDGQADIVIGSRFLSGKTSVPFLRRHLLRLAIIFTWFVSGVKLSDAHNGFRALSRDAASKIKIRLDRSAHASEIIDQIKKFDLRFTEVPVTIKYTEYSMSRNDGVRNENNLKKIKIAFRYLFSKLMQ